MRIVVLILVCFSFVQQSALVAAESSNKKKTPRELPYFRLPWQAKDYTLGDHYKNFTKKLSKSLIKSLPSKVDNSLHKEWPGISHQHRNNSCSQEGTVAGMLTYELNVLRKADAKLAENRLPSHFSWNFFNNGKNNGTEMIHGLETAYQIGIPSEKNYGGRHAKIGHWPNGYEIWHDAMKGKIASYGFMRVDSPESLLQAKAWLYNHAGTVQGSKGGMLTIDGTDVHHCPLHKIPQGQHEAGKKVLADWGSKYAGHVMCVVGYDDQVGFDINKDGKITNNVDINNDGKITLADYERGAFIVANSWGTRWGDQGKVYVLYRCLLSRSKFWDRGPFMAYAVPKYAEPRVTLRMKAVYPKRNNLKLKLSLKGRKQGSEVNWEPLVLFNDKSGAVPLGGPGTEGKDFELGLDLSKMAAKFNSVDSLMKDLKSGRVKFSMTWGLKDEKTTGLIKEIELLFWTKTGQLIAKIDFLEKEVKLEQSEVSLQLRPSIKKELNSKIRAMLKAHGEKDYPIANNIAKDLIKTFGQKKYPKAVNLYRQYLKNKKVRLEIKAATYLSKAEKSLKEANPAKDKIKTLCEKVIKFCPGTVTAKKAEKLLTEIQ